MKQVSYSIMTMLFCVVVSGTIDLKTPPAPAAAATVAAPASEPRAAVSHARAVILVRSGLGALDQANETGDYAALRAIGSARFRTENSQEKLAGAFAALRGHDLDAVLVLDPVFTRAPRLRPDHSMAMAGYVDSGGTRIAFDLAYATEKGRWRLAAMDVRLRPA